MRFHFLNSVKRGEAGGFNGWDTTFLPSGVVASNDDFTLTRNDGASPGTRIVPHAVTRTTGKYALRFNIQSLGESQPPGVGVRNGATSNWLGANNAGWGFWFDNTTNSETTWHGGTRIIRGDLADFATPQEVMMEIDIDAGNIWFGINGVWIDGDPAAGTSPQYSDLSGTIELSAEMYYQGSIELLTPDNFSTPASAGFTAGWPE